MLQTYLPKAGAVADTLRHFAGAPPLPSQTGQAGRRGLARLRRQGAMRSALPPGGFRPRRGPQ
eukprot:937386-Pyramimonas_sp.AAC.1